MKTPDGREMVYRTLETTTIRQGDTAVELRNLQQGSTVQILAEPAPPPAATGTQVVYPVASGIVVVPADKTVAPVPSAASVSAPPKSEGGVRIDVPARKDVDVDVDD